MAIRDTEIHLRRLHITTVFFDQGLCEAIGSLASHGTLQELLIGTSGTKLLAAGMSEMISFASGLKRLHLKEVQGRCAGHRRSVSPDSHASQVDCQRQRGQTLRAGQRPCRK